MATRRRRSIRLGGYDYGDQGPYFVTICSRDRAPLFGEIVGYEMVPNAIGEIVTEEWSRSPEIRPGLILDAFVLMPNHIHGIATLANELPPGAHDRAPGSRRTSRSLGAFIAGFKSATTKRINEHRGTPRMPVWQRNYYEHIIRSERTFNRIRHYIETNPERWDQDRENPANHDRR